MVVCVLIFNKFPVKKNKKKKEKNDQENETNKTTNQKESWQMSITIKPGHKQTIDVFNNWIYQMSKTFNDT